MNTKRAVTLVELLIVTAVFLITFTLLTPFINRMKDRADIIKCSNNVRLISLALHMFAADHNEVFPPALTDLYPSYIKEQKILSCPAIKGTGAAGRVDYEYVAALNESSPPTKIIVYDRAGNHNGKGSNVVRVNGSVEWVEGT